jgi:hypothetical protein
MANDVRSPTMELDVANLGDFPLYYTAWGITNAALAPNLQQIYLYNGVVGDPFPAAPGATLTELDTNLHTKNSLGYAEGAEIHAICCELPQGCRVLPAAPAVNHPFLTDMRILMDTVYFTMTIGSFLYSEGPMSEYPFFGGLYVQSTENVSEMVTNGMPQSKSMRPFAEPIKITSKDTFKALLRFPRGVPTTLVGVTAGNAYGLRWWLMCLRKKFEGTAQVTG